MASITRTHTFSDGTTAYGSQVETEISTLVTAFNNHDAGTSSWTAINVSSTATNPVSIVGSGATTKVDIDNTATTGDPQLTLQLSGTDTYSFGVDDSATNDPLTICAGGALGTSNIIEILATAPQLNVRSLETTTEIGIDNTAADGDVLLSLKLGGTRHFCLGVDDGDSDAFKIGTTAIGTNTTLQIPTGGTQVQFHAGVVGTPSISFIGDTNSGFYSNTGDQISVAIGGVQTIVISGTNFLPIGAGSVSTGDGSNYWNDVSYKTLTDRGCLPWCDEGVELQDGRIVSDTEALKSIVKHPTKKTIQGLPMLDYKTFPKKSYVQAKAEGKLLPRDANDEPIGGSDGVEMTMMFGVMIGAIKELTGRIETLEKK